MKLDNSTISKIKHNFRTAISKEAEIEGTPPEGIKILTEIYTKAFLEVNGVSQPKASI